VAGPAARRPLAPLPGAPRRLPAAPPRRLTGDRPRSDAKMLP
jgi:hypothetical protein